MSAPAVLWSSAPFTRQSLGSVALIFLGVIPQGPWACVLDVCSSILIYSEAIFILTGITPGGQSSSCYKYC